MMSYCAYSDCQNKYLPCSSITFFNIPKDYRREIWIENSGNPELSSLKPSSNKQFCEKHFDPKYLRRQFTRTVLRKDAIPYKFGERGTLLNGSKGRAAIRNVRQKSTSMPAKQLSTAVPANTVESDNLLHQLPSFENVAALHAQDLEAECLQEYTHIAELLGDRCNFEACEDTAIELQQIECNSQDGLVDREARVPNLTAERLPEQPDDSESEVEVEVHKAIGGNNRHEDDYDEDRHYALSLLGYFKRLPPKTKAIAKLKILQYLTELQFDDLSDVLD